MKKDCVIAIPVYKEKMSYDELMSFRRCLQQFNKDIFLFIPKGLNVNEYRKIARDYNKKIELKEYKSKYFANVKGYNDLCTMPYFYKDFSNYEYMLLYQLDAYVFDGKQLDSFIKKGYSFIGAPIFVGLKKAKELNYIGYQNGGLSLRKIEDCYQLCRRARTIKGIYLLSKSGWISYKTYLKIIINYFANPITLKPFEWEDEFFGVAYKYIMPKYKLAPYDDARLFSYDWLPSLLYKNSDRKLPFCCHAFKQGRNWDFWKDYIN